MISLVITIIILLILAGVAINLSLRNNGIFNRAKTAKEQYQNAQDYEETKIAKYSNEINSYVSGNRDLASQTIGDATAEDISAGKIAWVNGEKIVGTKPNSTYTFGGASWCVGTSQLFTSYTETILESIENNKSIKIQFEGNVGNYVEYYVKINGNTIETINDGNVHSYNLTSYSNDSKLELAFATKNGLTTGAAGWSYMIISE